MLEKPNAPELDAFLAAVDELRAAEQRVKDQREVAAAKALAFAGIKDKRLRQEAGCYAYWMAPEVSVEAISMGASGRRHPAKMLRQMGGVSIGISCDRCKDEIPVFSRNDMKALVAGSWWLEGYRHLCYPCQSAVMSERDQERRAQDAADHAVAQTVKAMSYAEYLASPVWQDQRERMLGYLLLDRRSLECEVCQDPEHLGFYHRSLEQLGLRDDLMMLCRGCREPLAASGRLAGEPGTANELVADDYLDYATALQADLVSAS